MGAGAGGPLEAEEGAAGPEGAACPMLCCDGQSGFRYWLLHAGKPAQTHTVLVVANPRGFAAIPVVVGEKVPVRETLILED